MFPVPAVLVSCGSVDYSPNIITIAWTGTMCSEPPMVYVSIRPGRHSFSIIEATRDFVINIPSASMARAVDLCGTVSGRNVDKFLECGFTPVPATVVKAPLINECPVNIECAVKQVLPLGTHHAFVAEVVAVNIDAAVIDDKGRIDMERLQPYAYCLNEYRQVSSLLGVHGFSLKNKGK
ncbi:MAG: flavin reductase family protein [Bacillota bacterium]